MKFLDKKLYWWGWGLNGHFMSGGSSTEVLYNYFLVYLVSINENYRVSYICFCIYSKLKSTSILNITFFALNFEFVYLYTYTFSLNPLGTVYKENWMCKEKYKHAYSITEIAEFYGFLICFSYAFRRININTCWCSESWFIIFIVLHKESHANELSVFCRKITKPQYYYNTFALVKKYKI